MQEQKKDIMMATKRYRQPKEEKVSFDERNSDKTIKTNVLKEKKIKNINPSFSLHQLNKLHTGDQ